MKKVLVVVDKLHSGGIATVVLNIAKLFTHNDVVFEFVCYIEPDEVTKSKLKLLDYKYYRIDRLRISGPIRYVKNIRNIIKENGKFDVIHVHTSLFIWLACYAAKKEGVKIRIGHAHGSKFQGHKSLLSNIISKTGIFLNKKLCTVKLACAEKSGENTFGKEFEFIPNFAYQDNKLAQKELIQLKDNLDVPEYKKILGYAGYIGGEKNTKFLVKILREIKKRNLDTYLVVAGAGHEEEELKEMFNQEGLNKYVKFIGHREDMGKIIQLFDIYLTTSFSEGMSLSILEAQINGIPCIVSNGVPNTNDIGANIFYKCSKFDEKEWVDIIKHIIDNVDKIDENEVQKSLERSGYDMKSIKNRFNSIYRLT